ncbi:MAG: Na(+)/H(+) antiporter NhaA [Gemmatimonadota bacterium]
MTTRILHMPRPALLRALPDKDILAGALLVTATLAAMVWANSPWATSYGAVWEQRLSVGVGSLALTKPVVTWINDALMAVFFLLVAMEIKREFLRGSLSSAERAALPLAAAAGGMALPAVLYLAINRGGPGEAGWGVPMATDIAFALGLLAIVARGAPASLKVLLAAVAIADDLGAILVIAVAYTSDLAGGALLWAVALGAALFVLNRIGTRSPWPYLILGVALWFAVLKSGVHATVAGVLLALAIPMADAERGEEHGLLERLEHGLHPWVIYLIVPLFALANAGVPLSPGSLGRLTDPVGLGILVGLIVGKQAGILSFSWIAVRSGVAALPEGVTWRHLHGVAALCGIGFTMAIFIGNLAFTDPALLEQAKTAILAASLLSAALAKLLLSRALGGTQAAEAPTPLAARVPASDAGETPERDEAA